MFVISVMIFYGFIFGPPSFVSANDSMEMETDTWDITWRYRLNVTLNEPGSANRTFWPIELDLNFTNGECINNSIRVLDNESVELPSQVWDINYYSGTSYISTAKVTFLANISIGNTKVFQILYSDQPNPFPEADYSSFGNGLNVTFNGQKATVINDIFSVEFTEGLGVHNYTLNAISENFHTNESLSPNLYNTYPSENQYAYLYPYEHLVFLAHESGTIRLYDGVTNELITSHTCTQYELWRYPGTTERYFSNLINKLVRIDSDIEATMMVTSLGEDNVHGGSGTVNNYYSGLDSISDDAIFSAYGTDLILWVPRDLYITAFAPTEVQIIDMDDDGDSDDSKTIILGDPTESNGYYLGWNTSMNPLMYTSDQYNSHYPAGDFSGDDNNNQDIFDNDVVRIIANADISIIGGYCANDYHTEVKGQNEMIFHFPILYRFQIVATEDNTEVYFQNLSVAGEKLRPYIETNDITGYRTDFNNYQDRYYLSSTEINQKRVVNLMKGDTIEFWDWPPDRNRTTGSYNYDSDAGSNIYDRWSCSPDFYKNNWANVTSNKPIKVYTGTSPNNDIYMMETTDYLVFDGHRNDHVISIVGIEDNTQIEIDASEDKTTPKDHRGVLVESIDINLDGSEEAVIGGAEIVLYNLTSETEIWSIPIFTNNRYGMERANWDDFKYSSKIKFANLTGDDYLDVIISLGSYPSTLQVQAIDGKTGAYIWHKEHYYYGPTDFDVGDINNDGLEDVVAVGYNNRRLIAYNSTNGEHLMYQYLPQGYGEGLQLIDANGDGYSEALVLGCSNNYIYTYDISKLLYTSYWNTIYNQPGWSYLRLDQSTGYETRQAITYDFRRLDVTDLDSDGNPEIVVGKGNENGQCYVDVYNYNALTYQITGITWSKDFGTLGIPGFQANLHRPYVIKTSELGSDSVKDIVVGLDTYSTALGEPTVVALNGSDGSLIWHSAGNVTDWVFDLEIDDLNQDGEKEVLVGCAVGKYSTSGSYDDTRIGNATLLSGTNGYHIWHNETSEGWIRSVDTAVLNSSTKVILTTTYTDTPQLNLAINQTSNLADYKNKTISFEQYGLNLTLTINKGEILKFQIPANRRGIRLNASSRVYIRQSGGSSGESIILCPIRKNPAIETITELYSGPVFSMFQVTWESTNGFHTTDNFTFYNKYLGWKIERTQYLETSATIRPSLMNTMYDIPLDNPEDISNIYMVGDAGQDVVTHALTPTYSSIVLDPANKLDPSTNFTLALLVTDRSTKLASTQIRSQYKPSSSKVEFNLVKPGGISLTGTSDIIQLEVWEMLGANKTSAELAAINSAMFNPIIFVGSTEEDQWVNLELSIVNLDGFPIEGANVTVINATRINSTGHLENYTFSEVVGADGKTTAFNRTSESNYLVLVNYSVPDNPHLNVSKQLWINANSTLAPGPIKLDLVTFEIQAVYESERKATDQLIVEDYLKNAIIYITNGTDSSSIANLTTNDNGEVQFIWKQFNNYQVNISSYGLDVRFDEMKAYDEGALNYSSATVLQGMAITSEINITISDDIWWNITSIDNSTIIEISFENDFYRTVSGFTLYYEGFLNTTLSTKAEIKVWDNQIGDWGFTTMDINSVNEYFNLTQQFNYDHVDAINNDRILVRLELEHDAPFNISIDQLIVNISTISGRNNTLSFPNSYQQVFDLTQSYTALLNCTGIGELPETQLSVVGPSNFIDPWAVEYMQNVTIITLYNTSLGSPVEPSSITASIKIKGTSLIVVSGLNLPTYGTPGYNILNFNTSEYLASGSYIVTISASKKGYESAECTFELTVTNLNATINVTTSISTFYQFNATVNVSYNCYSQIISDWTLSYYIQGTPTINGSILVTTGMLIDGKYNLSFSTTGLNQGFHNLIITVQKQNYSTDSEIIKLEILGTPTTLNGSVSDLANSTSIYVTTSWIFYYQFNDSINEVGIDSLNTLSWEAYLGGQLHDSGNINALGDGLYSLDFDTANRLNGSYTIWLTFFKNNYEIKKSVLFLEIELIPVNPVFDATLINVDQGSAGSFILNLTDVWGNPITDATISYQWDGGIGTFSNLGNGLYSFTIDNTGRAYSIRNYPITYTITRANHSTVTGTIVLNVDYYKFFGLIPEPIFWAILITAVVAIAAVSIYVGVKRARIPFEIKKIDETIKGIDKNKKLVYPVLREKAEIFEEKFRDSWSVLDLQPPIKGKKKVVEDDFIDLISSIKKIRVTPYEAETLKAKLITLSESEGIQLLSEMGVPPDTAKRLIKLAKK